MRHQIGLYKSLMIKWLMLSALSIHLMACGGGGSSSSSEGENDTDHFNTVPRLGPGPHLGMITGFDELTMDPYDQVVRVDELKAQARAAGMNITRFQIDWSELQSSPGAYETDAMAALLTLINDSSLPAYITLSTLDSGVFTLPEYLMDGEELAAGLTLSSPEVITAFQDFLDWFVPQLTGAGVWGLSIGNEGDTLLEDGVVESNDFIAFFQAGLARVNALDADLSASVTFTGGGYTSFPNETKTILESSDHASVNFYCLDAGLQVTQESTWDNYLADLKQDVGDKTIFFQELGCPVGYGDDGIGAPVRPENGMGGSATIQERFVKYMGDVFISDPQFIGATWFQLLDWSPALAESFSAPTAIENPLAGDLLEEWLATSGLCRWADGTCRVAWDQWLTTLDQALEERERR